MSFESLDWEMLINNIGNFIQNKKVIDFSICTVPYAPSGPGELMTVIYRACVIYKDKRKN